MLRWIFNLLTPVSLLLMLAVGAWWIRSALVYEMVSIPWGKQTQLHITSNCGRIYAVAYWEVGWTNLDEWSYSNVEQDWDAIIEGMMEPVSVLGVKVASSSSPRIYSHTIVRFGHWHLMVLFSILPLWWVIRRVLRPRRRRKRGECVKCGYSLRGSAGACPECGASS